MRYGRFLALAVLTGCLCALAPTALAQTDGQQKKTMTAEEKEAERAARMKLATDGLDKLYRLQPDARQAVEAAPGYAVFDISSIYAVLFVGQRGKGVLFNNVTKEPTYMSSTRAGTGPGLGAQRVYQVFVFKTKSAMEQFVIARGIGGDVGASISVGREGITRSFNPSIDIYQIPESGLAVQASWGGTVYSVDGDLR